MVGAEPGDDDADLAEIAMNPRMCIVTRRSLPADDLIRFVLAPDGAVVADLKRRLPGRGAHVEAKASAVRLAAKRGLFKRALGGAARPGEDLAGDVDALLARSALGALGLARKAGQVATGAGKVDAELRAGRAAALLQALDGAEDGLRKMEAARRAGEARSGRPAPPVHRLFEAAEMGLALGGGNVVHAAVLAGDAGSAALKRLTALTNYRDADPAPAPLHADRTRARGIAETNDDGLQSGGASGTDERCGAPPAQEAEA